MNARYLLFVYSLLLRSLLSLTIGFDKPDFINFFNQSQHSMWSTAVIYRSTGAVSRQDLMRLTAIRDTCSSNELSTPHSWASTEGFCSPRARHFHISCVFDSVNWMPGMVGYSTVVCSWQNHLSWHQQELWLRSGMTGCPTVVCSGTASSIMPPAEIMTGGLHDRLFHCGLQWGSIFYYGTRKNNRKLSDVA